MRARGRAGERETGGGEREKGRKEGRGGEGEGWGLELLVYAALSY
jgi:hypothetical protein